MRNFCQEKIFGRLPGRKASVGMGSSRLTEERVDIIYKVASKSFKI